jgi:hypothetical protein
MDITEAFSALQGLGRRRRSYLRAIRSIQAAINEHTGQSQNLCRNVSFNKYLGVIYNETGWSDHNISELPKVSVICPTIRPTLIPRLYSSLICSTIPFELILLSPCEFKTPLPNNCYIIKTTVRPSQCMFIGLHAAKTDYVISAADDFIFGDFAIDKMLKMASESTCALIQTTRIYLSRYFKWKFRPNEGGYSRCYNKHTIYTLGINRKVHHVWDEDLSARFLRAGFRNLECNDAYLYEPKECVNYNNVVSQIKSFHENLNQHSSNCQSVLPLEHLVFMIISHIMRAKSTKSTWRTTPTKEKIPKNMVPFEYTDDILIHNQT